jgi:hypothetical protein
MLQCKRLRLARQLASPVLQFHTTPFLEESWRSEDVIFFEIGNGSQKPSEPREPHLNVNVRVQKVKKFKTPSNDLINTNPYTFGLGAVLLELAYQAPLRSFQESVDLTDGQEALTRSETFYRDVVSELDRLEQSFARIQIG